MKQKRQLLSLKTFFICLVILGVLLFLLEITSTTHIFHKQKPPPITMSALTKGEPIGQTNSTTSNGSNNQPGDEKNSPGTLSSLIDPSGNFVSNHHPNLSGSPAPNTLQSVCNTTPGASCQISFINTTDGQTKSLAVQSTDRGGATYWSWKLQDVGVGVGNWKIQATATLNGQSATANDALTLEVAP